MTDVIDAVLGVLPDSPLAQIRARRAQATANAQATFQALFDPVDDSELSRTERRLVALFVATISGNAALADLYDAASEAASDVGGDVGSEAGVQTLARAVLEVAAAATTTGPFGHYREEGLIAESTEGLRYRIPPAYAATFGPRLTAALEHAHLLTFRPREASAGAIQALFDAGHTPSGVVTLSQLVAFLHFQHRVVWGLAAVIGEDLGAADIAEQLPGEGSELREPAAVPTEPGEVATAGRAGSGAFVARTYQDLQQPQAFTRDSLGWVPWVEPLPKAEFTQRHWDGLVQKERADFPYFALLARDPEVLKARTLTDLDIFYNEDGGLPRAERELAAAAVSRVNGCVFCASVHARAAATLSDRAAEVDELLDGGITAVQDPRWAAITQAAAQLTATPSQFDAGTVAQLRASGLSDGELYDLVHAAAFFNWANRLMLSLGEPKLGR